MQVQQRSKIYEAAEKRLKDADRIFVGALVIQSELQYE